MTLRTIALLLCVVGQAADGFIFPDLKSLRIGNRVQSTYKIAVLQEEPFLSVNGTGYVPDLLQLVADWYATSNADGDVFPYEIYPVATWDQLLTKASASHWQIAFGLCAPSLIKTEGSWKSMLCSHATVHSGLQLIGAKPKTRTAHHKGTSSLRQMALATTTTTHSPSYSTEGVHNSLNVLDAKGATVVALEGSPEAYILQKHPSYRHNLKTVKNNDEALGYILLHPNSYLLKDSAVSDHLEEQFSAGLSAICKGRGGGGAGGAGRTAFNHGFFGKDTVIISFFNSAFRHLRTAEKDQIKALNRKYFGHLRTCPF